MYSFPFSSFFNRNECLVRSRFPSLPLRARWSCASNHTFHTNPVAVSVERANESFVRFMSAGEMGGWCWLVSFPFLRRSLITDLNTPLLDLNAGLRRMSSSEAIVTCNGITLTREFLHRCKKMTLKCLHYSFQYPQTFPSPLTSP